MKKPTCVCPAPFPPVQIIIMMFSATKAPGAKGCSRERVVQSAQGDEDDFSDLVELPHGPWHKLSRSRPYRIFPDKLSWSSIR
jgi:hypothetical protein